MRYVEIKFIESIFKSPMPENEIYDIPITVFWSSGKVLRDARFYLEVNREQVSGIAYKALYIASNNAAFNGARPTHYRRSNPQLLYTWLILNEHSFSRRSSWKKTSALFSSITKIHNELYPQQTLSKTTLQDFINAEYNPPLIGDRNYIPKILKTTWSQYHAAQ